MPQKNTCKVIPEDCGDDLTKVDRERSERSSSQADSYTCQSHTQGLHFWRQKDQ